MPLPTLSGVPVIDTLELEGKRVFIRLDLNTPLGAGAEKIRELRLQAALPSIRHAVEAGAKVILGAHLGEPGGVASDALSLEPAGLRLAELLDAELYLPEDVIGDSAKKVIFDLRDGQVALLENLAFHPGEARNDEGFALKLGRLFDVYVNDAPGVLDQKLASTVLLPRYSRQWAQGLGLHADLVALQRLTPLKSPVVSIVQAPDLSATAFDVVDTLLTKSNVLCLGPTLAGAFASAQGRSDDPTLPREVLARCRTLIAACRDRGVTLVLLPEDADTPEHEAIFARVHEHVRQAGTLIASGGPPPFERALAVTRRLLDTLASSAGFSVVTGDDAVLATLEASADSAPELGFVARSGFPVLKLLRGDALPGLDALAALA